MYGPTARLQAQVDYVDSKAKRVFSKITGLLQGRKGINLQLGIGHYKSLVRPHLEYAVPVWAAVGEKEYGRMEQVQFQCLRSIVGAKACSSSAAIEVICGVMPIKIRIRELCSREYLRIKSKENNHILRTLLEHTTR